MDDAAPSLASLVPPQLRELMRSKALVLRRPVFGRRLGRHRSARAGVGLDFRDHRAYVPGDDPRLLDWRAVARRERLVLRQTEAEDELSVVLLCDTSGGMAYGAGAGQKFAVARTLAGGLAVLASRQGDAVGFGAGGAGETHAEHAAPRSGPERLAAIASMLHSAPLRGACPWTDLLTGVSPRLPRRSVVVVVSDFLHPGGTNDPDEAGEADLQLIRGLTAIRARRHDVVLLQVLHPDELEFPWAERNTVRFTDLLGLRKPKEGAAASMRQGYLEAFERHQAQLTERCDREGLLLHTVRTDTDPAAAFLGLLARFDGSAPPDIARDPSGGRAHDTKGQVR